ncbi:hypothetical protein ABPG74_018027 [Tetrahymena malaccensis]
MSSFEQGITFCESGFEFNPSPKDDFELDSHYEQPGQRCDLQDSMYAETGLLLQDEWIRDRDQKNQNLEEEIYPGQPQNMSEEDARNSNFQSKQLQEYANYYNQVWDQSCSSSLNDQEDWFILKNMITSKKDDYSEELYNLIEQTKKQTESKWVCKFCKQKYSYQGSFTNHIKTKHYLMKKSDKIDINIYDFLEEPRIPRGRAKGSKSIKKHSKQNKYQCICKKSFSQYGGLKMHIEKAHNAKDSQEIKTYFITTKCRGRPSKNPNINKTDAEKRKVGRPQKTKQEQI